MKFQRVAKVAAEVQNPPSLDMKAVVLVVIQNNMIWQAKAPQDMRPNETKQPKNRKEEVHPPRCAPWLFGVRRGQQGKRIYQVGRVPQENGINWLLAALLFLQIPRPKAVLPEEVQAHGHGHFGVPESTDRQTTNCHETNLLQD